MKRERKVKDDSKVPCLTKEGWNNLQKWKKKVEMGAKFLTRICCSIKYYKGKLNLESKRAVSAIYKFRTHQV